MLKNLLKQIGIDAEFTYDGFLYGHYDSRGGTTFIVAENKQEADLRYLKDVCCVDDADLEDERAGWLSDYLGAATLHSPVALTATADLEDDDKATVFAWGKVPKTDADGWDECHRSGEPMWSYIGDWFSPDGQVKLKKRLIYSPDGTKPNDKAFRVGWDDDAFSFIFVPAR